jgi:Flp pilus assembly protein TadG
MEALFVLPIFSLITIGLVGISDLLVAEQLLSEASARGARTAALGGTEEQIRDAVNAVLGPVRSQYATITVTSLNNSGDTDHHNNKHYTPGATPDAAPVPPGSPGGWKCRPGQLIQVCVQLDVQHATCTHFCPVCGCEQLSGCSVIQCE